MISNLVLKIKRRETPFYQKLYTVAKQIRGMSLPSYKPIHLPLYHLHVGIKNFVNKAIQGLWIVPLFKARCNSCGSGLRLPNGMPEIIGNPKLVIGDNVQILDSTLASGHVFDNPTIQIGNQTVIGYHSDISAAKLVIIGRNTLIAKDCFIADNDGHPVSPRRRINHESVNKNEVDPVHIGNTCWIGTGSYILKGANIGDGCIVAANSVVAAVGITPPTVTLSLATLQK